jgi:hypothetical protein
VERVDTSADLGRSLSGRIENSIGIAESSGERLAELERILDVVKTLHPFPNSNGLIEGFPGLKTE